ncbi:UNVERIFIED_CONTAM: hypothetical protein Sindi_1654000 [Sesamum indicum]
MWVGKYIWNKFAIARTSLVKPHWLANDVWLQLQAYCASADSQGECAKNNANRTVNPDVLYCVPRGSSSVGMHKRKMEAEHDRPSKQIELFARCYKKKANDR